MNADQCCRTAFLVSASVWPLLTILIIAAFSISLVAFRQWRVPTVRQRLSRELAEKIMAKVPDQFEHIPVDSGSVTGLRQDELNRYTEALENLGFRKLQDFRILGTGETIPHSFGRTMVNDRLCCFAEVMATQKILETSGPLLFGFSSFLEDGWTIGSGLGVTLKASYLRRLPKYLVQCEPGSSTEELLRRHLALRQGVTNDLEIPILEDISLEGYRQRIRERMKVAREAFLGRDILADWEEATRIAQEGKWEWLGAYPEEAAKRTKSVSLRPLRELSPTYEVPQRDVIENLRPPEEAPPSEKPDE
jgi:hypothetical protein